MSISFQTGVRPLVANLQKPIKDAKTLENAFKNFYAAKSTVDPAKVQQMYQKILKDPSFNWRGSDLCRLHPEYAAAIESKLNLPALVKKSTNLPAVIQSGTKEAPKTEGFIRGLWGRLKSFAKTPKGKAGLAIAAATTGIGLVSYLYARNKDYGGPVSDSSPINDLANMPAQGKINADGSYTVAKGDNLWCIARSILMELHKDDKEYELTDVKIMQYMENIMHANNLKYEEGSYKVVIQPNQSLKLTA